MTASSESRVTAGLNDYRFVVSLHVEHPSISPDEMTGALKQDPTSVRRRGEKRRRPDGGLLTGVYDENHWNTELEIVAGHDVSEFLADLVDTQISHAADFTRQIDDTDGCVTVFIGVFADRLCDFEIPASTLRRLGNAGISVRLDYYGVSDGETNDTPELRGQTDPPMTRNSKS